MNRSDFDSQMRSVIENLSSIVVKLIQTISSDQENGSSVHISKSVRDIFTLVFENPSYVLLKCGNNRVTKFEQLESKRNKVDIFGIYKYFTNPMIKMESNYYVININGFNITNGIRQSRTFYINDLLNSVPTLYSNKNIDEIMADGNYIEKQEIITVLTDFKQHLYDILTFWQIIEN